MSFIEAAASPASATNRVAHMARLFADARAKVDRLTAELKAATDLAQSIELEDLPELMKELGISSLTLADGSKVEVVEDLKCGISAANLEAALAWVRAKGDGGIIKTKLGIEFGRDEDAEANRVASELRRLTNRDVDVSEGIHHSTLKAYLKERREEGDNVPADLFGLYVFNRAKLSQPKKRK